MHIANNNILQYVRKTLPSLYVDSVKNERATVILSSHDQSPYLFKEPRNIYIIFQR
jgi:hypothetical protein